MRREVQHGGRPGVDAPIRLVEFTRSFYIGGTEVQVVELLRGLPSKYQIQVAVLGRVGPLLPSVLELGYDPQEFPLKGSLAKPNTAVQIARLAKWLKTEKVQLVHVHDFYSTLLAVPAAKLAGVKVIVGRLDLSHWHGPSRRALLAQMTRMADHVVANAVAIKNQVVAEEGIPASKVTVIPNGLDLKLFAKKMAAGVTAPVPETKGAPVILHVANMNHPVKRQEDLFAAMVMVRRRVPDAQLWLVGDGPRRKELEQLSRTLGLTGAVHFLGFRDDVAALYARTQVGVLCSTAEGLSNAVMEGMAASVPMVVTRVGANPDLIRDGVNGRLVEPQRPAQLSDALVEVLRDPEHQKQMGKAAREYVERELTLEQLAGRHDAMYREVLNLPSPSGRGSG